MPAQPRSQAYYNDTDLIDIALYEQMPWRADVFKAIEAVCSQAFDDLITEEDCDKWRTRTIRWYSEHSAAEYFPMRYVSMDEMLVFIDAAAERISELLKELK